MRTADATAIDRRWRLTGPPKRDASPASADRHAALTGVQYHIETFLAQTGEADPLGNGVPWWVEEDFRAYVRCDILAHGFARSRRERCDHQLLIAFSCKGRGVCPSCRRIAAIAAHKTDHVLPHFPTRQWVPSVPKRLVLS